jgi:branched-chain amino acid transport system ATP-binding protein
VVDQPLLRVDALSVSYGGLRAVDSVSIDVPQNSIVGLIGPNGAGKTTFIDALTGFAPSTGEIIFDGESIAGLPPHQRTRRGLSRTFQSLELFEDLTVAENLQSATGARPWYSVLGDLFLPARKTEADLDHVLDMLQLREVLDDHPNEMSHGMRKLVSVARALVTRPKLLLLDEPAAGLSSGDSLEFGRELRKLQANGLTTFLVDHDMGLVLSACDYIYVLEFGKLIAEGPPAQIRKDPQVINAYLGAHAAEQVREGADDPGVSAPGEPTGPQTGAH